MAKKIRVYLDTQDFNNLASSAAEYAEVREYLVQARNSEKAEFGYSYPLVFELFRQYDEKHKDLRIRIARCVKALCGYNAFPHFVDLATGSRFPNDGFWMPRSAVDVFSPKKIEAQIWSGIREGAVNEPRLNRKLKRKLTTRSGVREVLKELPYRPLSKADFGTIPISNEVIEGDFLRKYISGTIDARTLSRKFTEWLVDPEVFIQIWYEYAGKHNPLEEIVDRTFNQISSKISMLHAAMADVRTATRNAKRASVAAHKALHNADLPIALKAGVKLPKPPKVAPLDDANLGLDAKFGVGRGIHFDHYFNALRDDLIKPARSDLIDLLHLVYLQDVDLFRCDRRMANLMKACPGLDNGKIVSSLRDLPNAIDRLAASAPSP